MPTSDWPLILVALCINALDGIYRETKSSMSLLPETLFQICCKNDSSLNEWDEVKCQRNSLLYIA
jgi:hypothetical protein